MDYSKYAVGRVIKYTALTKIDVDNLYELGVTVWFDADNYLVRMEPYRRWKAA